MRILQVHNRYRQPGGEDAVVDAEVRLLRDHGHEVEQLIGNNPSSGLAAARALASAPWNPVAAQLVRRTADRFHPDVVHVHNTWFALSPSIIAALSRREVPLVMTLHNYRITCANAMLYRDGEPCELCVGSTPWHGVRYACYRGSRLASIPAAATIDLHRVLGTWATRIHRFIALTEFQRGIMARAGLPKDKIQVVPNFVPDPGRRQSPPSRFDTLLFAGRLTEEKGADLLLDAWVKADIPGLQLMIAGEGPRRSSLESRVTAGVRLLGKVEPAELARVMLTSRALILPSQWYEGLPRVLLEAMAAGLPVIGSDRGGPAEVIVQALGPEWLFALGDRDALVEALTRLPDDDWCDGGGARARLAFEERYSESGAAERLIGVYEGAISDASIDRPVRGA